LAKYVKQFNHSTLVPFVIVKASTPGVIKVTEWNKQPASLDAEFATLPSKYAPPPASPSSKPLGSAPLVTEPCVITDTFLTYGERDVTVYPFANSNAYPGA